MSRTSLPDQLRRDWFRIRFSWYMQDYPGREYRRINTELRRELAGDDPDRTLGEVLDDLGHPRVLAEGYKSALPERRPRYVTGAVAAGLTLGTIAYLCLAYSFGFLDALAATGGGSATIHPLGTATTFTSTADEISVESALTWQWLALYIGAGTVAFVLGSRLWRMLRRD